MCDVHCNILISESNAPMPGENVFPLKFLLQSRSVSSKDPGFHSERSSKISILYIPAKGN